MRCFPTPPEKVTCVCCPGNLGLAICHTYLKVLVPLMRNNGTGPCAKLTFADAIQVCLTATMIWQALSACPEHVPAFVLALS